MTAHKLGTVEASEALIQDLYLELRQKVHKWAAITKQTSQARMGYVGQHLVSVATGFPGGKSGARGYDIVYPNGTFGEIKTCYRVDQLGKCEACGAVIASTEVDCSSCGSKDLKRNDDSKWLISIRNDDEFWAILEPKLYYLVLFEFEDLQKADVIVASIWTVDPTVPGFALCMIDYYQNIRSKSTSKAPFNLWPRSLKFELMRPVLIYRSRIEADKTVKTELFPTSPGRDEMISKLEEHAGSRKNLGDDKILALAVQCGLAVDPRPSNWRVRTLRSIREHLDSSKTPNSDICDLVARTLYLRDVKDHLRALPEKMQQHIRHFVD